MNQLLKVLVLVLLLYSNYTNANQITAQSWVVANSNGEIIAGENTKSVRSIASITKLMTAMVVLDAGQDLDEKINSLTRRQMIQLALVRSDNVQSKLLCEKYPGGHSACVRAMNLKAEELNLPHTKYTDSSGLGVMNTSTAEELIRLLLAAENYPEIVEASQLSEIKIELRKKWFIFKNTNPIIGKKYKFIVSKTGWTNAAGGCIAMMMDTDVGRRIVIVLGSKSTKTRIPEAEFLTSHYR